ncbi:MAG: PTS fructose transporter subunit IIB [Erysipelotrichaceae bacterium]|nr:PTS fructose transporter subunit IIB [Erysipelotrichaceae bacterium]
MKIVGVTACPTGIAHTYMAQEALEKKAKEMGHVCHIETQGSIGIENELSKKEIKEADVVLLAVEVAIEGMERFEGKKIIRKSIGECIANTQGIIFDVIAEVENS